MADTNAPGRLHRAAWWVLAALFAMNLLNYIDRFILAAVLGQVQNDPAINADDWWAGLLAPAFLISYTVFSVLTGWFGDRMPRKYLLSAGVGLWSVATFASGFANSYWHLFLARCVLGVGEAAYATLAPSLIGDFFRRDRRNLALTVFYLAIPVGAGLGYVIGGQVSEAFGTWRAAFFVVGLPGLVVALAALAIPEPRRGASEDVDERALLRHEALPLSWDIYAAMGRNRSYLFVSLGMAAFTFALGGLQYWAPEFLVREQRFTVVVDEGQFAHLDTDRRAEEIAKAVNAKVTFLLGVVVLVSGLAGTALGGVIAEMLSRRWRAAYFWVSGFTMLASAPFILAALLTRSEVLIFGCLLIGLTLAFMQYGPTNTIIVNVTDPKIRAAAFAVNIFIIHLLGDIPSPPLMGGVSRLTGSLFWGVALTIPAMAISGVLFCLGTPYQEADQEAVLRQLRSGGK